MRRHGSREAGEGFTGPAPRTATAPIDSKRYQPRPARPGHQPGPPQSLPTHTTQVARRDRHLRPTPPPPVSPPSPHTDATARRAAADPARVHASPRLVHRALAVAPGAARRLSECAAVAPAVGRSRPAAGRARKQWTQTGLLLPQVDHYLQRFDHLGPPRPRPPRSRLLPRALAADAVGPAPLIVPRRCKLGVDGCGD